MAGINAGCMLLAPDSRELDQMLEEIEQDDHPSHCEAPGPEQDYLSRWGRSETSEDFLKIIVPRFFKKKIH
jgi:hypothetical protein